MSISICLRDSIHQSKGISVHNIICVASGWSGFRTRRAFQKVSPKVSQKSMTKDMTKEMSASSDQVRQIVSEIVSDKLGRILCDRWSFWDRNFSSADWFWIVRNCVWQISGMGKSRIKSRSFWESPGFPSYCTNAYCTDLTFRMAKLVILYTFYLKCGKCCT